MSHQIFPPQPGDVLGNTETVVYQEDFTKVAQGGGESEDTGHGSSWVQTKKFKMCH